jgi:hypothetical protein
VQDSGTHTATASASTAAATNDEQQQQQQQWYNNSTNSSDAATAPTAAGTAAVESEHEQQQRLAIAAVRYAPQRNRYAQHYVYQSMQSVTVSMHSEHQARSVVARSWIKRFYEGKCFSNYDVLCAVSEVLLVGVISTCSAADWRCAALKAA